MARLNKVARVTRFAKSELETTALLDAQGKHLACRWPRCWAARCATPSRYYGRWSPATPRATSRRPNARWPSACTTPFKLKVSRRSLRNDVAHISASSAPWRPRLSYRRRRAWSEADAPAGLRRATPCGCTQHWAMSRLMPMRQS